MQPIFPRAAVPPCPLPIPRSVNALGKCSPLPGQRSAFEPFLRHKVQATQTTQHRGCHEIDHHFGEPPLTGWQVANNAALSTPRLLCELWANEKFASGREYFHANLTRVQTHP